MTCVNMHTYKIESKWSTLGCPTIVCLYDVCHSFGRSENDMSVRYAILGLLAEQPMHGYQLKKVLDKRLSPLWGLTTGQIYQSLSAIERLALAESRTERRRHRPPRRIYSITAAGTHALAAWLGRSPTHGPRTVREEIIVRMMLLDGTQQPNLERWFERECDEVQALLSRLHRMQSDCGAGSPTRMAGLYLASLQHRLEADLKCLELFRRHHSQTPSEDP